MTLGHRLASAFLDGHPTEAARVLERMPADRRVAVVRSAGGDAAPALGQMAISAIAECLSGLAADEAAPVLDRLAVDTAIAALRRLPAETADRLVDGLPHQRRDALRRVLRAPDGTAAALVDPAILMVTDDLSVAETRLRLRREAEGLLHYIYVVDRARTLVGVLDISELMRARSRDPIRSVMRERVEHLPAWMPATAVRSHSGWRSFHAMPVTDEAGRLIGAIRYQTLRRLEQEADGVEAVQATTAAVAALGELFHLGVAGFVEGISTAAAPRRGRARPEVAGEGGLR
jgi:Mg/Co/Ni transporter MgtE